MESGRLGELVQQGDGNWPNTFRSGSLIPAVDYLRALRLRRRLQEEMAGVFREVDLYVTVPFSGPGLAYTNLTGHPALIARCGVDGRRPLSIEFVGNLFAEAEMLRTALAFERAMGRAAWPDPAALPETPP
jgi:aspartyl-tRNA(Asn)/glutamyl-tRNA(Gln) amidotransferase subunit A